MRNQLKLMGYPIALMALGIMAAPAQAQFGRIFRPPSPPPAETSDGCEEGSSSTSGSRILGGILGGVAGDMARDANIPVYVPVDEFTDQISSSIACKLDPDEQKQAADATIVATRGTGEDGDGRPEVGQSASWQSNTREDVSGTSTVVAREDGPADGMDCIMVTDVIIVSGEETRAEKRMCRAPGSARYSIVA